MDQSYFRFLFRLARKSKQSGLSKSEKSLAKRNATLEKTGYVILIGFFVGGRGGGARGGTRCIMVYVKMVKKGSR